MTHFATGTLCVYTVYTGVILEGGREGNVTLGPARKGPLVTQHCSQLISQQQLLNISFSDQSASL